MSLTLALVGLAGTPAVVMAQAKPKVALKPSVPVTVMSGGWKREVSVTVLGGYAATGSQLYYFPSPFDPLTGIFSPTHKIAIGPSAIGNGKTLWKAPANSTTLGNFSAGQQLVFGLWLPNNTWFFSAAVDARSLGLQMLSVVKPQALVNNQPAPTVAGTDYEYYGFGVKPGVNGVDYNDFVFRTNQATVTPEPATMTLLGLGLAAMGGVRARRRRLAAISV
ncbi:MAG: PEP-CTERM sorting domain-containing protein [Gemmatimonadota bacterium]